MKLPLIYLLKVIKPVLFVFQLLQRIFWLGLNGRNPLELTWQFAKGFSMVFTWLLIFKNAGLIPKKIRPHIWVKLPYRLDQYLFDLVDQPLGLLSAMTAFAIGAWILHEKYYTVHVDGYEELSASGSDIDLDDKPVVPNTPGDFQDDPHHQSLIFFSTLSHADISARTKEINTKLSRHIQTVGYFPYNSWRKVPVHLLALSWFILNIDYLAGKLTIVEWKDTLAWLSYVLGHFLVPLFTAIWLYVFHAPGLLKLFGLGLGIQNIAGVLTHLLVPCAPPWFITLYGENKTPSYDMPGYAAGLTRVKYATGTHLVDKGFHASPIVFGAVPSLHLAMAVMCSFYICYYSRWTAVKVASLAFVVLQWWATIYLDHHWRLDLLVGMLYTITTFTIMKQGLLGKKLQHETVQREFMEARLHYQFAGKGTKGSTMGMRVFRNTCLEWFFDPLA